MDAKLLTVHIRLRRTNIPLCRSTLARVVVSPESAAGLNICAQCAKRLSKMSAGKKSKEPAPR